MGQWNYLLLDSIPDLEMNGYHFVCFVLTCIIIFHSRFEPVQSRSGGIYIIPKTTVVKF
jgi:hypothetical protein